MNKRYENDIYENKISTMNEDELEIISKDNIEFSSLNKENIEKKFNKLKSRKNIRMSGLIKKSLAVACSLIIFVGGVNTNESFAQAMYSIPLLGDLAKLVTIDRLIYESDTRDIDIEIPEIIGIKDKDLEKEINKMIKDKSIKLYDKAIEDSSKGKEAVLQTYVVKRNDEEILGFGLVTTMISASAYETVEYYNIDIFESKLLSLDDLFKEGSNYYEVLDNKLIEIMKDNMKNEGKSYFLDQFKGLDDQSKFYINEDNKLVIVFNEYEIAPGSMGVVELEINTEDIKDIISDKGYIK